jgi:hypothetical protein
MCNSKGTAITHRLSALKADSGKLTLALLLGIAPGADAQPRVVDLGGGIHMAGAQQIGGSEIRIRKAIRSWWSPATGT